MALVPGGERGERAFAARQRREPQSRKEEVSVRKTISPTVTIVVVVIVVLVVGYFFWQKVKGPGKTIMTPQGPVDARTGELLGRRGGGRGGRAAGAEEGEQQRAPARRGGR